LLLDLRCPLSQCGSWHRGYQIVKALKHDFQSRRGHRAAATSVPPRFGRHYGEETPRR
jgi:hypothetical protein